MTTKSHPLLTRSSAALFLAALALAHTSAGAAVPILEYTFNGSGTTAASTGSTTASLNLRNASQTSADMHSADGLGVSGFAGDKALDLSSANGMGNVGGTNTTFGGSGSVAPHPTSLANLTSFTLQLWFKTDGAALGGSTNANVLSLHDGSNGISLTGTTGGLQLRVDGGTSTVGGYTAVSTWVFLAITYDGNLTSNNVKFYRGGTDTATSLLATTNLNAGAVNSITGSTALIVGNSNITTGNRPFDGFIDNLRIFGSTDALSSGVLSLSEIEAIRYSDVTAIPEPSAYALMFGAFAGTAALVRRRRRAC